MNELYQDYNRPSWPTGVMFWKNGGVLTAVTLLTGIYCISTAVLIALDGVFYIEVAKQITDNVEYVIRGTGQAPGYPFLIYMMHHAASLFYSAGSLEGWIISAQVVSLLSKLIAVIAIYFIGSYFAGARWSFWGTLVLVILPDSIEYGSDVLTDWPSLMFMSIGFLLLLLAVEFRKRWIFAYAGAAAGFGYMVRPECAQVVLYGVIWLMLNLVRPQGKMKRTNTAGALVLLLAGFAVITVPYMRSTGYVFPEQRLWKLPAVLGQSNDTSGVILDGKMAQAGLSLGVLIGNETLATNLCETLVYYFVPGLLTGCYFYFRKQLKTPEQTFFAASFIIVNITLSLWQSSCFGFLSRRHTFILIAFTVFYIPMGLHLIAVWLTKNMFLRSPFPEKTIQHCFFVLMAAGIGISVIKTGPAPLRGDKQGYRDTAAWLKSNTDTTAIVAVMDKRIAFYAQRQGVEYREGKIPEQAGYVVKLTRSGNENPELNIICKEEYSVWVDKKKAKSKLVTYKVLH
jgi:hypothetical protein